MKVTRIPISFLAVFTLCVAVFLASCSKKDVKMDEPLISPSGDSSGNASVAAPPESAGDVGTEAADLQTVYYDYDKYQIRGDAREALKSNANWLKKNPSARVQIEGHCDERGTTEYNLALGERRANSAKEYLVKMGIDGSRIDVISYGEERPSDSGHDEAAWAKNRRAAFVILSR